MNTLTPGEAIVTCLRQFFVFSGRARRSEYWWFFAFGVAAMFVTTLIDAVLFPFTASELTALGPLGNVVSLVLLVPMLAVGSRRMHDTGRSGWWLLIQLIPLLGPVVFGILAARRGTAGHNAFGAAPTGGFAGQTQFSHV
ncbi:Inner membrane protein yhaH [Dermatophilus congolensis]|uniref:Inner membrane protein yhaH n=1 Tax=Dermatophilus congolensis TaxID=1863 RepID=A0AA46BLT9_9MICO|nr:DUF805 domain-containing protein [Dermatophilus congolensis]STD04988.1 Inner membrane protein yhaH [Dermatophilus congolensis]